MCTNIFDISSNIFQYIFLSISYSIIIFFSFKKMTSSFFFVKFSSYSFCFVTRKITSKLIKKPSNFFYFFDSFIWGWVFRYYITKTTTTTTKKWNFIVAAIWVYIESLCFYYGFLLWDFNYDLSKVSCA